MTSPLPVPSRPKGLGTLTLVMVFLTIVGLGYWIPKVTGVWLGFFFGTTLLIWIVLWFFWRGQNWARWMVIVTIIVSVFPRAMLEVFLLTFTQIADPSRQSIGGLVDPIWSVVVLFEGLLGAYLLFWLFTRRVRKYFTARRRISAREDLIEQAAPIN